MDNLRQINIGDSDEPHSKGFEVFTFNPAIKSENNVVSYMPLANLFMRWSLGLNTEFDKEVKQSYEQQSSSIGLIVYKHDGCFSWVF